MKNLAAYLLICLPLCGATLSIDPYCSPYTGADLIETSTDALMKGEDSCKFETSHWTQDVGVGAYRLGSLVLFWAPYGRLTSVVQHEFFGHGYRLRSLRRWGFKVDYYYFNFSRYFDHWSGATGFIAPDNHSLTQEISIAFGGTEAQTLLAMQLRESAFESGMLDGRRSSLYFNATLGLLKYVSSYIDRLKNSQTISPGNDIGNYMRTINSLNPNAPLTKDGLKAITSLCVLDPFFWGQAISSFTYILFGKEYPTPVFTWNSFRFTPSISPNLTPFGPEVIIEQYFSIGTSPFKTYFRYTPLNNHGIYGLGFKHLYLAKVQDTHIGCILDAWLAPPFNPLLSDELPLDPDTRLRPGIQAMLTLRQSTPAIEGFHLGIDLGYKTSGYLIGTPLQAGFAGRLLASIDF